MKIQYIFLVLAASTVIAGCNNRDSVDAETQRNLDISRAAGTEAGAIAKPNPDFYKEFDKANEKKK